MVAKGFEQMCDRINTRLRLPHTGDSSCGRACYDIVIKKAQDHGRQMQ